MFYRGGLVGRVPTVIDLFTFARYAGGGFNPFTFFGLTVKKCPGLENVYTDGCSNMWLEERFQGTREMNRSTLSRVLARVEQKVADYVGYWPGPKYIENERHFMKNWNTVITTDYMRVPVTGQRERALLFSGHLDGGGSILFAREFRQQFHQHIDNIIRYTFGDGVTDLGLPDHCNLLLYPQLTDQAVAGSGDEDLEKTRNEGYLLRPYTIIERTDTRLVIDVPLVAAVKPEFYWEFPDIRNNMRLLNACDENNFVENISVYAETFDKPDGHVKIAKDYCNACGGSGCDECTLPELPICMVPVSSELGIFQIKPIRNTGTDENPCWIIDDLESCCASLNQNLKSGRTFDNRWAHNCFCTKPLELCINYVSSCNNCYGDDCLDREPCPELLEAIINIVLAEIDIFCDCTCFKEWVARLRDDWTLRGKGFSRGSVTPDFSQYALGQKVGHVEAYLVLQHVAGRHRDPRIGMVGG